MFSCFVVVYVLALLLVADCSVCLTATLSNLAFSGYTERGKENGKEKENGIELKESVLKGKGWRGRQWSGKERGQWQRWIGQRGKGEKGKGWREMPWSSGKGREPGV